MRTLQAPSARCTGQRVAFRAWPCPMNTPSCARTARIQAQGTSNTTSNTQVAGPQQRFQPSAATCFMAAGIAMAAASSLLAEPAAAAQLVELQQHAGHAVGHAPQAAVEQFQLAEGGQEFWSNLARYGRYFVTVMLGTGYVMVRPLAGAFKNPLTAVLTIAGIAGAVFVTKFTLQAMLGVDDVPFDYVQGEF